MSLRDRKSPSERRAELSERHSERLISLRVSTERLREHNDELESKLREEEKENRWLPRKSR